MSRIARAITTALLIGLLASACSARVLSDAEQEWGAANPTAVLDAFGTE